MTREILYGIPVKFMYQIELALFIFARHGYALNHKSYMHYMLLFVVFSCKTELIEELLCHVKSLTSEV